MKMTTLQSQMHTVFSNMLAAAIHYRATGEQGGLIVRYGICDNIPGFAENANANTSQAIYTKESLIRRTPNYSGRYHYPVPSPIDGEDAGTAFDRNADKWQGEYGAERVAQLEGLIQLIANDWDDKHTTDKTPAQKLGYTIGDTVIHKQTGELWIFESDDDSASPYFRKVDGSDASYVHLDVISKVKADEIKGGFAAMMKALDKDDAKIAKINAQIAKHEAAIQALKNKRAIVTHNSAGIELAMLKRFKVKRAK